MRASSLLLLLSCVLAAGLPAADGNLFLTAQHAGSLTVPTVVTVQASLIPEAPYIVEDSPDLKVWNRVSPVLRSEVESLTWSATHNLPNPFGTLTLYGGTWHSRRFYRFRPLPPEGDNGGEGRLSRLTQPEAGLWEVTTAAGWKIRVAPALSSVVIFAPNGREKMENWGDGNVHENLNGAHLKDWFSDSRTVIFPGEGMVTLTRAKNPATSKVTIKTVSIYDSDQTHRIDMHSGTVTFSRLETRVGEAAEPDGETCRFWDTGSGALLENIYTQEPASNTGLPIPQTHVPLGKTGGDANPSQVNDLFDDPRLGHT